MPSDGNVLEIRALPVFFCRWLQLGDLGGVLENWDEVRTAFHVARMGTVSGAADVLGVHHATVIRHIDSLEKRLGVKLFQRHARGYTATEAGNDLLRVAQATDNEFNQLAGRIKGRGTEVSGELVVTSLIIYAPQLVPVLTEFQSAYPDVELRYLTGTRLFRLEYGEAHVAIRAGPAPQQPDNVAQPFLPLSVSLFASRSYVQKYGKPGDFDELDKHRFVCNDDIENRAPFHRWLRETVDEKNITFWATDERVLQIAVESGAGIGFLDASTARSNPDLIEVLPPLEEWSSMLWLVTHVDLHRTSKVQAFLTFLKDRSDRWGTSVDAG